MFLIYFSDDGTQSTGVSALLRVLANKSRNFSGEVCVRFNFCFHHVTLKARIIFSLGVEAVEWRDGVTGLSPRTQSLF